MDNNLEPQFDEQIYLFSLEKYLMILKKSDRITLTKLRASIDKLPVVSGRYNNVERENRVCTGCSEGCVGDEFHVMVKCQNQNIVQLRRRYMQSYYWNSPTEHKYVMLMQNTNGVVMKNFVQFLRSIFNMFR